MSMKLYHRTSFWGKDLHGYKARGHKLPIIQVQAIVGEESGTSFGCCRHHGKRCCVIDESHFIASSRGEWDLYHVKTVLGEESKYGDYFHDFALMPRSKATTENLGKGWTMLGSIRPCAARMDLVPLLRPFLTNNSNFDHTYATHHAHIALVMEMVTVDDSRHERRQQRKQKQHSHSVVDERWQTPEPGTPFYSRENTAQQQKNGKHKATAMLK